MWNTEDLLLCYRGASGPLKLSGMKGLDLAVISRLAQIAAHYSSRFVLTYHLKSRISNFFGQAEGRNVRNRVVVRITQTQERLTTMQERGFVRPPIVQLLRSSSHICCDA